MHGGKDLISVTLWPIRSVCRGIHLTCAHLQSACADMAVYYVDVSAVKAGRIAYRFAHSSLSCLAWVRIQTQL